MRASYRAAVAWIAWNDEPAECDLRAIAQQIAVALVADLFGKPADKVARAVVACRKREGV